MLNSGHVDLAGLLPDLNRYRLALLKQMYLAACMRFGYPKATRRTSSGPTSSPPAAPRPGKTCRTAGSLLALPCCASTNPSPQSGHQWPEPSPMKRTVPVMKSFLWDACLSPVVPTDR